MAKKIGTVIPTSTFLVVIKPFHVLELIGFGLKSRAFFEIKLKIYFLIKKKPACIRGGTSTRGCKVGTT